MKKIGFFFVGSLFVFLFFSPLPLAVVVVVLFYHFSSTGGGGSGVKELVRFCVGDPPPLCSCCGCFRG